MKYANRIKINWWKEFAILLWWVAVGFSMFLLAGYWGLRALAA